MSKLDSLLHDAICAEDTALLEDAARHKHRFSPRYRREMRNMFHPNRGTRRRSGRLLAAVLAATLLVGSVTAAAFWTELQSFFHVAFPRFMGLQSTPPVQPTQDFYDLPTDWGSVWLPMQLPEGYTFYRADVQEHVKKIEYISASGDILIFSQSNGVSYKLEDSEGIPIHDLNVGSSSAYAWEKINHTKITRVLVWSAENITFTLSGQLTFDELIAIGETLQLTEIGEC